MSSIPENLMYTAEHEWVLQGEPSTVGVTATAADALGDVVYRELPAVGVQFHPESVLTPDGKQLLKNFLSD
jgi:glycine cleavage system H protein